jgi:hypothetical protein
MPAPQPTFYSIEPKIEKRVRELIHGRISRVSDGTAVPGLIVPALFTFHLLPIDNLDAWTDQLPWQDIGANPSIPISARDWKFGFNAEGYIQTAEQDGTIHAYQQWFRNGGVELGSQMPFHEEGAVDGDTLGIILGATVDELVRAAGRLTPTNTKMIAYATMQGIKGLTFQKAGGRAPNTPDSTFARDSLVVGPLVIDLAALKPHIAQPLANWIWQAAGLKTAILP